MTPVSVRPSARVVDADGRPVKGVHVIFAGTTGQSLVVNSAQTSGADGVVTVSSWVLGKEARTYELTAVIAQNSQPALARFYATASPGAPTTVTWNLDTLQLGIGSDTAPAVVAAADQWGNPIALDSITVTAHSVDSAVVSITPDQRIVGAGKGRTFVLLLADQDTTLVLARVALTPPPVPFLPMAGITAVAVSSQNVGLVVRTAAGVATLERIDMTSGDVTSILLPAPAVYPDIAVDSSGARAYVSRNDGRIFEFDIASASIVDSFVVGHAPSHLVVAPGGVHLLVAGGGTLSRIELASGIGASAPTAPVNGINGLAVHPTQAMAYVAGGNGWIGRLDYGTMTPAVSIEVAAQPRMVRPTADASALMVARATGAVQIRDAMTLEMVSQWLHLSGSTGITRTPDERQLIVTGVDAVRIASADAAWVLGPFHITGASRVAVDPTSERILVAGVNGLYFLW